MPRGAAAWPRGWGGRIPSKRSAANEIGREEAQKSQKGGFRPTLLCAPQRPPRQNTEAKKRTRPAIFAIHRYLYRGGGGREGLRKAGPGGHPDADLPRPTIALPAIQVHPDLVVCQSSNSAGTGNRDAGLANRISACFERCQTVRLPMTIPW